MSNELHSLPPATPDGGEEGAGRTDETKDGGWVLRGVRACTNGTGAGRATLRVERSGDREKGKDEEH